MFHKNNLHIKSFTDNKIIENTFLNLNWKIICSEFSDFMLSSNCTICCIIFYIWKNFFLIAYSVPISYADIYTIAPEKALHFSYLYLHKNANIHLLIYIHYFLLFRIWKMTLLWLNALHCGFLCLFLYFFLFNALLVRLRKENISYLI